MKEAHDTQADPGGELCPECGQRMHIRTHSMYCAHCDEYFYRREDAARITQKARVVQDSREAPRGGSNGRATAHHHSANHHIEMFELLLQHISQGDYERLRRQFVDLTSQLEQAVVVQLCDGGGYTITYPWQRDGGEVYPSLLVANAAREAVIYQKLLNLEAATW